MDAHGPFDRRAGTDHDPDRTGGTLRYGGNRHGRDGGGPVEQSSPEIRVTGRERDDPPAEGHSRGAIEEDAFDDAFLASQEVDKHPGGVLAGQQAGVAGRDLY